ncbi:hypothetical protein ACN47E_007166 [Coniothyrium glycines]
MSLINIPAGAGNTPIKPADPRTPETLHDRFRVDLAKLFDAEVQIKRHDASRSLHIFITMKKQPPHRRRKVQECSFEIEAALREIASEAKSCTPVRGIARLRAAVHKYLSSNIVKVIRGLAFLFAACKEAYDDLVTKQFGFDELECTFGAEQRELATKVIQLYHATVAHTKPEENMDEIIAVAAVMAKDYKCLREALWSISQSSRFSRNLRHVVMDLGFRERVVDTLVCTAQSDAAFKNINLHLLPVAQSKRVSFVETTDAKPNSSAPRSPLSTLTPPQRPGIAKIAASAAVQSKSTPAQHQDVLSVVRPYLHPDDRSLTLLRMAPDAKRESAELAAFVLRGLPPPCHSAAWLSFGFAAANTPETEGKLAKMYQSILLSGKSPRETFRLLQDALEQNTLVSILDDQDTNVRGLIPQLSHFLSRPRQERESVWMLKQFTRADEGVDPSPLLQRDYGFKVCRQRDEVERLKRYYEAMLQKMGPRKVHDACVHGRLFQAALSSGLDIPTRDKRLLSNDGPASFIGFDNGIGVAGYERAFFKRPLRAR